MKDRIFKIMKSQGMTAREFANALDLSPSSISSIFNGHTSPTNNHVQAIHRRFPEINVAWLMFGEGEMLNDAESADKVAQNNGNSGDSVRPQEAAEPKQLNLDYGDTPQVPPTEAPVPGQVIIRETVKLVDKPQRKITEIRVFYDDGTFDTFSGNRE